MTNRRCCDHNGLELILPLLILYNIDSYKKLISTINEIYSNLDIHKKIIMHKDDIQKYLDDILIKKKIFEICIYNFNKFRSHETLQADLIDRIYISGKNNKHNFIKNLNKTYDKKTAKSDIYITYTNENIVGMSIKQDPKSTKSNYSIHKLLGSDLNKMLNDAKRTYLTNNGFPTFDKTERMLINKLFYPSNIENNTYLQLLKKSILENTTTIKKQLIDLLYSTNVNYDIYEFDGIYYTKLTEKINIQTSTFVEYLPYYFTKTGKQRNAAKLFYRLTVYIDGYKPVIQFKIYRVEVRWKGSHYVSPQFHIHNESI